MAEMEEAQVFAVIFDSNHVFKVLMSEVFESYRYVVGVQQELREVFELQDMGDLEPFYQDKDRA